MDPIKANIIYFSDTRYEPRTYELMWWGLSIIEILLFIRLFFGTLLTHTANTFSYIIYKVSNYLVYPFTILFGSDASGSAAFVWATTVAMITYLLLTIGFVNMLKINTTPHSRIEHARALSRKKYSR